MRTRKIETTFSNNLFSLPFKHTEVSRTRVPLFLNNFSLKFLETVLYFADSYSNVMVEVKLFPLSFSDLGL